MGLSRGCLSENALSGGFIACYMSKTEKRGRFCFMIVCFSTMAIVVSCMMKSCLYIIMYIFNAGVDNHHGRFISSILNISI